MTTFSMRKAVELTRQLRPDLELDGEMQVDAALVRDERAQRYPFSTLTADANVLVFPNLDAANIAYKLLWRFSLAAVTALRATMGAAGFQLGASRVPRGDELHPAARTPADGGPDDAATFGWALDAVEAAADRAARAGVIGPRARVAKRLARRRVAQVPRRVEVARRRRPRRHARLRLERAAERRVHDAALAVANAVTFDDRCRVVGLGLPVAAELRARDLVGRHQHRVAEARRHHRTVRRVVAGRSARVGARLARLPEVAPLQGVLVAASPHRTHRTFGPRRHDALLKATQPVTAAPATRRHQNAPQEQSPTHGHLHCVPGAPWRSNGQGRARAKSARVPKP
ncbi:MAG: hypothetical protein JNK82_39135 [Myxococcaceae bacterium]|nr:hypothetical protein [Myxococcaceae bacterium]